MIVDANSQVLMIGTLVDPGDGSGPGRVVQLHDPDPHCAVSVEWPDFPGDPEIFIAHFVGYGCGAPIFQCADVVKCYDHMRNPKKQPRPRASADARIKEWQLNQVREGQR
jgi:hypothetical protein